MIARRRTTSRVGSRIGSREFMTLFLSQSRAVQLDRWIARDRFRASTERMNVGNTRWTGRDLLRASRLVSTALRRTGSPGTPIRAARRCGSLLRSVGDRVPVFAGVQQGESVSLHAWPRPGNVLHPELAA